LPASLKLSRLGAKAWPQGDVNVCVERERRFAVRHDEELLSGSIDRLVVIQCGGKVIAADVIDFKTDEVTVGDAAGLQKKAEFYRPQLDAYRAAAAKLLGLAPEAIGARLVFLSVGKVV
jgi:ATP-dependent helicase/nuclease subunit A